MNPLVVSSLSFAAVFLAVFAANAVLVDLREGERRRLKKRLDERVRKQQQVRVRAETMSKDFSKIAAEAMAENPQAAEGVVQRLQLMIDQSGLDITILRLLLWSAACALAVAVVPALTTGHIPLALLIAAAGATLPMLYVYHKRQVRLKKMREQLPDAFGLMSRMMRSGQTISQAMKGVGDEFPQPISMEFLFCYEQMNLGLTAEAALRELGHRSGLLEMKIFVLAVLVQRQTGGNLAELLDKLGFVVRERFRIRGMIDALTAQGRFQALILLGLPPFMFCILMLLRREYEVVLLEHPMMIVTALTLLAGGAIWIRNIVNFDW